MPGPDEKQKNKILDDSMQRVLQRVLGQMPDVNPVTLSAGSPNPISMPRGAMATTNPFTGNIRYNPEMMQGQSPDEIGNTVAHELTHSRQAQNTPWWRTAMSLFQPDVKVPQGITPGSTLDNPYVWRPSELEAFQTERNRQMMQPNPVDPIYGTRDINLVKGPSRMR